MNQRQPGQETSGNQEPSIGRLRLAERLAALSIVTDLGSWRLPETAMQACLLATRLAQRMDVSANDVSDVYYTTLLRSVGCTAYAHEEAVLLDDAELAAAGSVDWADPREALGFWLHRVASDSTPLEHARIIVASMPRWVLIRHEQITSHCEVGAAMVRRLELAPVVQQALQQVFERWDGKGSPHRLAGERLVLPVRFAQVATVAAVFWRWGGPGAAIATVKQRGGAMLDPWVAAGFLQYSTALLAELETADVLQALLLAEPEPLKQIPDDGIDSVARAFGDMVDLKLPFTRGHSSGVSELAEAAARRLRFNEPDVVSIRRAGLLHDLGRMSVSNRIWEKRGPLTASEWEQVRLHAYQSERILVRSPLLAPLAPLTGMHHERQDGSGYHRQATGNALPLAARVLAAADAYQAMTQERPYRPALAPATAAGLLATEVSKGRLDGDCVRAVLEVAGHRTRPARSAWPAGLSDREVEVLQLIATGGSYRDVAQRLVISPKTARHHIEHVYNKIGVSTRAAAAMFAMEHDLVSR
ncbi:MAG: HD domain-containing protein [Chloroflexi bacterium]|nr:MAG: HD domain-containing protein [Chloroflexota bacterium]